MPRYAASWIPLSTDGDELARDHAALDRVGERVALAARQRLEAHPAVAELAASARLLLVPPLRLRRRRDRLAVRDAGLLGRHVHVVLPLHALDLDLEVQLAHAARDRLVQLGVELGGEGRVLLVQPRQHLAELVVVVPRDALDRDRDVGLREVDLLQRERALLACRACRSCACA